AQAGALGPVVDGLTKAIETENVPEIVRLGVVALGVLKELFTAINAIGPVLQNTVAAAPRLTDAQRARLKDDALQLPKRIVDHALITHLEGRNGGLAHLLQLLGIVDVAGGGFDLTDPTVVPVPRRAVRWDRLLTLLTSPAGLLDEAFDFGKSTFDGAKLLRRIGTYLQQRGQSVLYHTAPEVLDAFAVVFQVDQATTPPSVSATVGVPAGADVKRPIKLSEIGRASCR